jgi:large subunit ribosomal protein L16
MFFPKKVKFKKPHKNFHRLKENKVFLLTKGVFGLKSIENKELNIKQLESVKKTFLKKNNRQIKIWVNVFTDKIKTKKPLENRMGKGKGNFNYWFFFIRTGFIIFEFSSYDNQKLDFKTYKNIAKKLPLKTKLIFKNF